jgi:hypothetical protein
MKNGGAGVRQIVERWRDEANRYQRDGALVPADTLLRRVADDLEEFLRRSVDVHEAAALTGYTEAHLRELARERRIPAFKEGDDWRFVAAELPAKPKRPRNVVDEVAELRAAAKRAAG